MPRAFNNPCSRLPRRLQIVASLSFALLLCIIFLGKSDREHLESIPFGSQIHSGAQNVADRFPRPFAPLAHAPPPEQKNSSSGETRWYADWGWKNPFSSDTTLDEQRAVLPPLPERPPIYTYFDPEGRRKDDKSRKAEQDLLQVWRRAWWAKGFKPVVLSSSEAMNNPLYRIMQGLRLQNEVKMELMRWLAWSNMGNGILCNWLAVPMAPYDDALLAFFRRGEYPYLSRYEGLGDAIFVGTKSEVETAIKEALASPDIETAKSLDEALPKGTIQTDMRNDGIAFYSSTIIKAKYPVIQEKLENATTRADGLAMLPHLINSHLHLTFQNVFADGIAVVKPLPQHTTALIEPAIDMARNLTQCSYSPIPASCPPNRSQCRPCVSSHVMISTPPVFRNQSTVFTISTVPHPYTITRLHKLRDTLDLKFIRRETERDIWLLATTQEALGTGLSSFVRLPFLKEAVASEHGSAISLWLTAERPQEKEDLEDWDWAFGFQLPRQVLSKGQSETPVPGPERRPPRPKAEYGGGPAPSEQELKKEHHLLQTAKDVIWHASETVDADITRTREIVEAWNLADTEAWKFVRAYNARRRVERKKWEQEEANYLGKGLFDRWIDKIT